MSARLAATRVLSEVLGQRHSLSAVLPPALLSLKKAEDRPLVSALCYGVLRWHLRLNAIVQHFMHKPLKKKDVDIQCLLLLGLYQLIYMRVPKHAAVSETVAVTNALNKSWAKGLVNAVLRNYQRNSGVLEMLDKDDSVAMAHPDWLLGKIKKNWPDEWPVIVNANNRSAPIVLRVNINKIKRQDYLNILLENGTDAEPLSYAPQAIKLAKLQDVTALPGFDQGWFSVQDGAAQLAAPLLDVQPNMRVLDACAAPGGKSCHILECEHSVELTALDHDEHRTSRIHENLQRLGFKAKVLVGDASRPESWWDGQPFDRILLDAPCSATGVIRRHPDIKYLRRADDIAGLVKVQGELLRALWQLLRPGGQLLYATCSVLSQENSGQILSFLKQQKDAREVFIQAPWGMHVAVGYQIMTGDNDMDGFYYACLKKAEI
ncbi:MAG: 16S rRNA (cytosine(967)-C(5))-methyltransferase RsmB [Gammaproteobacteria bacterium]|nr:16S rRNA (cytosine(967)-C(5))-methyltransferase RsmB [Gammaproteobacteria bacterium]